MNLLEYSTALMSNYEPINPLYVNDKDYLDGALNCSGTFSQLAEERHLEKEQQLNNGAIENTQRLPANKSGSGSTIKPTSPDSALNN
jgi:hypothetical protein